MTIFSTVSNERGAVLITGLLLLVIMTLIGITAMQSSTLEEVMTRNMGSRNVAFHAAEMALRDGERFLTGASLPAFSGTSSTPSSTGLYSPYIDIDDMVWDNTDSAVYSGTAPTAAAAAPRYIIENLGPAGTATSETSLVAGSEVTENNMYRVTAYGVGTTASSIVILQSTYAR